VVFVVVLSTGWIRVNVSASVPYGVYRVRAVPRVLTRGMLVVLAAPAVIRPWWRQPWVQLLKPVAALPGDQVCAEEGVLWIAGVSYGRIYAEAQGKALPHLENCQVVPDGAVFLASPTPKSLDGRYWLMTPVATLRAQAVPLFTWR
jgi:conjugative transfer signal peptidase TraF